MDAETRDAIRDLCEAVATVAGGTYPLIGDLALGAIEKARRCSERMDALDAEGAP